jgi:hypothetical protein
MCRKTNAELSGNMMIRPVGFVACISLFCIKPIFKFVYSAPADFLPIVF